MKVVTGDVHISRSCALLLKCAYAKIALTVSEKIVIVNTIFNRKNGTNQRTIVERLRNVNFFMTCTVYTILHIKSLHHNFEDIVNVNRLYNVE